VPYFDNGLVLVSPAAAPIADMRAISGHSLAYAFGSQADGETRRWLRRLRAFETRPYETARIALDSVRLKDADGALVEMIEARMYQREHPGWHAALAPITHVPYVAAVRIDRARLAEAIDAALVTLNISGVLDALIARWL
jgi:ABC-type amino acid transport substrate-binding protein